MLAGTTSIGSLTGEGELTDTQLFTSSGAEDTAGSRLFATFNAEDNSALSTAQVTTPAATQDPVQNLMAIPATVVNIAAGFVTALLAPFLAPGPVTPAQPPLMLFAVLDWLRREVQRTFFNRSPNAVADVYTTSEDIGLSGNVLTDGADDTDADGDELTATLVTGPAHGDLTLNSDGSFTYTPDADYNGTDTFTYKVSDEGNWHLHGLLGLFGGGGHTDTAAVTISVTAASNQAPVAGDDNVSTNEDTYVTFAVLTNDTDADGDPLSVAVNPYPQAAHGSVAVNGDGTLSYLPNFNFSGTDTITYTVTDGDDSDTGTVTVTVNPVNDMPVAMGDNYTVVQNGTLDVAGPGVLQNDTDLDGDPLTAVQFTDPSHGSVTFNADGSFTYTPDADFFGTDSFEYYADDGTTTSGGAFVNITVTEDLPNAAPVANYDSFATEVDTSRHDRRGTAAGQRLRRRGRPADGDRHPGARARRARRQRRRQLHLQPRIRLRRHRQLPVRRRRRRRRGQRGRRQHQRRHPRQLRARRQPRSGVHPCRHAAGDHPRRVGRQRHRRRRRDSSRPTSSPTRRTGPSSPTSAVAGPIRRTPASPVTTASTTPRSTATRTARRPSSRSRSSAKPTATPCRSPATTASARTSTHR